MLYPKIEDCLINAQNSKYVLVSLVAKRAKDLSIRVPGQFEIGKEKEVSYALHEVFDGKIVPSFVGSVQSSSK